MDDELSQLAESHGGVFTTAQAYAIGHDRRSLARARADRTIVSLGRSMYALSSALPDGAVERHALAARAALLVYPDAVTCGVSLLARRGIVIWGAPLDVVDLVRPVDKEVLTQSCRIRPPHPLLRPTAEDDSDAVAKALALTAIDHGFVAGVVAADDALHRGLVTASQLSAVVEELQRWPHAGRAQTMLALADGRSESAGESRVRLALCLADIAVEPQVVVEDPPGSGVVVGRVDLLIAGTKIVVEFDGKVKYADGDPEVLWREKKREDRLRRLGYTVIRVTWAELERPAALLARIRAEIAKCARVEESSPEKQSLRGGSVVG